MTEPIPTDCSEDSIIAAVTYDVPTETIGAVIAALVEANELKDRGATVVEVARGAVFVPVFGRPKTLVDVLEFVTEAVVVWVGAGNKNDMGELNPPN